MAVESNFQLGEHIRDLSLLVQLQQIWGGIGSIYLILSRNKVNYSIGSKKYLTILINHLEKYTLLTPLAFVRLRA